MVVNLSKFSFDPHVFSLLEKGLNFVVALRRIPVHDIICDIEFGIRDLPEASKDIIRQDCAVILRKAKPPKNNLNNLEFEALKALNNNNDIIVLKTDKGGATVILKREDYWNKMLDHLCNSGSYRKLAKNPLKKISKTVALVIKSSSTVSSLSKKLIESNPLTRRIYGLPKIHKEGAPLCPIVNTIRGPTYLFAKYIANRLKPPVG